MKKIFIFTLGVLLLPVLGMCFQAGPKSQANFGKNNQGDSASAAQASNGQTRSFSTYGAGRTWSRPVQTQGVRSQGVQTRVTGRDAQKEEKEEPPSARGGFVDPMDGNLTGLKDKIANGGKGGNSPAAPKGKAAAAEEKQAAAPQKAQAPEEEKPAEQPGQMPAGMDAVMQQMGQMQNMMGMLGAMGGGAAGGAQGAKGGAMPAGMPDISALMGSMGGGGAAPAKK